MDIDIISINGHIRIMSVEEAIIKEREKNLKRVKKAPINRARTDPER